MRKFLSYAAFIAAVIFVSFDDPETARWGWWDLTDLIALLLAAFCVTEWDRQSGNR